MIIKLKRDNSSLVTYVNLDNITNITENNGLFEFKENSSTVATFSVANTTISYCNNVAQICDLPRDVEAVSMFLLNRH